MRWKLSRRWMDRLLKLQQAFDQKRARFALRARIRCEFRRIATGSRLAQPSRVTLNFVYILKNADTPPHYYTGLTTDPVRRLRQHNAGECRHTARHMPWKFDVLIEFADPQKAIAFERYLKSGSGVAFSRRHLR